MEWLGVALALLGLAMLFPGFRSVVEEAPGHGAGLRWGLPVGLLMLLIGLLLVFVPHFFQF